jgi:hypothetical protein
VIGSVVQVGTEFKTTYCQKKKSGRIKGKARQLFLPSAQNNTVA